MRQGKEGKTDRHRQGQRRERGRGLRETRPGKGRREEVGGDTERTGERD